MTPTDGANATADSVGPAAPGHPPVDPSEPFWRGALIIGLTLFAASQRFLMDDAYISYRYAANLVAGHGLVFNRGEYVEGYTNFLWTLLHAGAMWLGLAPELASMLLGLGAFAAALALFHRAARALGIGVWYATVAMGVLGLNATFLRFATGGLETMLHASLVLAVVCLALEEIGSPHIARGRLLALSLAGAALVLTRLDGAPILALCGAAVLWRTLLKSRSGGGSFVVAGALLVLPAALILGAWQLWRMDYYGDIVPNTYWAKRMPQPSMLPGLRYLGVFAVSYVVLPLAVAWAFGVAGMLRTCRMRAALLHVLVAWWMFYIVRVGPDFMEFRFLVAMLPIVGLIVVWALWVARIPAWFAPVVAVATLGGSLHHAFTFQERTGLRLPSRIETVRDMADHLDHPMQDWRGIGVRLAELFAPDSGVVLSVGAAGAQPFYAGLETIDNRGLSDRFIARFGLPQPYNVGHYRAAPLHYLMHRRVNLIVLGIQADTAPRGAIPRAVLHWYGIEEFAAFPPDARRVDWRMSNGRRLVCILLRDHPAIRGRIEAGEGTEEPLSLSD